jgi:rRNA pseudouridine-1189 N-methylase Emg1 (Nep1/Mra1 family)
METSVAVALVAAGAVVAGSLMTLAGSYVNAWASDRRQEQRDKLADRRERDAFQRETLLAAQNALTTFARVRGKAHHVDKQDLVQHGTIFSGHKELSEEEMDARRDLVHLAERIVDDNVRAAVKAVLEVDMRALVPRSVDELEAAMAQLLPKLTSARETLGEALRRYLR